MSNPNHDDHGRFADGPSGAHKHVPQHRVGVTVSEPDHPMVTKRQEQVQKFVRVRANSTGDAVARARQHYSKAGYKVHATHHIGRIDK